MRCLLCGSKVQRCGVLTHRIMHVLNNRFILCARKMQWDACKCENPCTGSVGRESMRSSGKLFVFPTPHRANMCNFIVVMDSWCSREYSWWMATSCYRVIETWLLSAICMLIVIITIATQNVIVEDGWLFVQMHLSNRLTQMSWSSCSKIRREFCSKS